jgi:hypothetical protein
MCNLKSVSTYEGTHNIHTLIIGERVTGLAAYKERSPSHVQGTAELEARRMFCYCLLQPAVPADLSRVASAEACD